MDARKTAREIAEGSIVLLKNEGELLPFCQGQKAAFFGRAQLETIISGNGSGAAKGSRKSDILSACEARGILAVPCLKAFYKEQAEKAAQSQASGFDLSKLKNMVNSGLMYEIFGKYTPPAEEFPVPEKLVRESALETETAVLVLGRQSGGEECDRRLEEDYYLTASEKLLTEAVCGAFEKVAVVLNINGLIDLSWLKNHPSIKSVLFLGIPGEEGPAALANILCGAVTPSGKLAVTVAGSYEDYPAHADFSWDKAHPEKILTYEDYGLSAEENGSRGFVKSPVTVYRENLYLGYRYADSFEKKPLFPFGFGLSYTRFDVQSPRLEKEKNGFRVTAAVKNQGGRPGKEVLQLYISGCGTASERPFQELKGFEKTRELKPGEQEDVSVFVPWEELACYEEETASFVIEAGTYLVRLGNSSANNQVIGQIRVQDAIVTRRCGNRMGLRECNRGKIGFLHQHGQADKPLPPKDRPDCIQLAPRDVTPSAPAADSPLPALPELSIEELAALCVGYGPGTPFAALSDQPAPDTVCSQDGTPLTTNTHPVGSKGYVSPAIEGKGIRSIFYKDGPAGVGRIAWPTEMLLACSFDRQLCRQFGDAAGFEAEQEQVDVWLAPAVNLHRHPLGGRNFEYFSEDPFLTGACACAVTQGVQENHPVLVCAKHFAVNEQETYRRGSSKNRYDAADSILTERTARELYLKPFEMLVRNAGLHCLMTSFNKINGVFAGGNKDLCTHILREEWGFHGVVVTDWGDMDTVVDGADAAAAGNDVVMPGGPPVIAQILQGYKEGRVTREALEKAVGHLLGFIQRFGRYTPAK